MAKLTIKQIVNTLQWIGNDRDAINGLNISELRQICDYLDLTVSGDRRKKATFQAALREYFETQDQLDEYICGDLEDIQRGEYNGYEYSILVTEGGYWHDVDGFEKTYRDIRFFEPSSSIEAAVASAFSEIQHIIYFELEPS